MGEPAKCESCGATKNRPRMRPAPVGWLYIETKIDDAEDDGIITHACSWSCANKLWRTGPGPLMTDDGALAYGTICTHCSDTHRMPFGEQIVACTRCPTPCHECRPAGRGRPPGAFCETTPCPCACHSDSHQYRESHRRFLESERAMPPHVGNSQTAKGPRE